MHATTDSHDGFEFTVWGRGVSCALAHAGRSVHWQGDEAAEIVDRIETGGQRAVWSIWDEYEHIAEED